MASASGQGEFLKKRSVSLFQLNIDEEGEVRCHRATTLTNGEVLKRELSQPVLINILDLIDLLLDALAGHMIGLQLINLLVNEVRGGLVEILQEVLDHLGDDVVGLLLILPLIGQVCFRVTCEETGEGR